jgi:hypothetical protein
MRVTRSKVFKPDRARHLRAKGPFLSVFNRLEYNQTIRHRSEGKELFHRFASIEIYRRSEERFSLFSYALA